MADIPAHVSDRPVAPLTEPSSLSQVEPPADGAATDAAVDSGHGELAALTGEGVPGVAIEAASAAPLAEPVVTEAGADTHADVELIGRSAVPAAQLEVHEEPVMAGVAAAVAAATMQSGGPGSPTPAATPAPAPAPVAALPAPFAPIASDTPMWSFDGPADTATAGAAGQGELPLPAVISLPPPRPTPLFGPIGRRRSMVAVAALAVVTFGVYALVWHRRVNRELEEFDPKLHARPGRSTLALTVPWWIGLLTSLAGAAVILADHFSFHLPVDPHVSVTQAYFLLGGLAVIPYLMVVLPFSLVAVVMTLERLRSVEEHVGLTADRQVRAVASSLWLLVPVVGGLILVAMQQRRVNVVWSSVAPAGRIPH